MESEARLWTLLLLSSHEEHSHLLPDSLVGVRPPKKIKPFSLQKHHIVILAGWGEKEAWVWCSHKGEQSKSDFLLAKCVVQLKRHVIIWGIESALTLLAPCTFSSSGCQIKYRCSEQEAQLQTVSFLASSTS